MPPGLDDLSLALVNADKAGDADAARTLADEIQRQRSTAPMETAPQEAPSQPFSFRRPLSAAQQELYKTAKEHGWGSGLAPFADELGGKVTDLTGSPALGTAANIATQFGPTLLMQGPNSLNTIARSASLAKQASLNVLRDKTLAAAREAGFVVPPSASNAGFITNRLESIAGKAATGQEATARNQQAMNALARKDIGLPEDAAISQSALDAKINEVAAPYREVERLASDGPLSQPPFVSPKQTLEELKQTRTDATNHWRHYDVSADPAALAKARELSAKADQLEQQIEVVAAASGKPGLVDELRAARTQIAKIHDVSRALNLATGDVSMPVLGRMLDRGKPLTGGLEVGAKFQQAFPRYAREGVSSPPAGVSKSEAIMGSLLGTGGFMAGGVPGIALGALPLLSGPARSAVLSKAAQRFAAPSYGPVFNPAPTNQLLMQLGLLKGQQ